MATITIKNELTELDFFSGAGSIAIEGILLRGSTSTPASKSTGASSGVATAEFLALTTAGDLGVWRYATTGMGCGVTCSSSIGFTGFGAPKITEGNLPKKLKTDHPPC